MKTKLLLLGVFVLLLPSVVFSTPFAIDTAFNTSVGTSDMNGMQVTIDWQGSGTQTYTWDSGITDTWGSLNLTIPDTSTMGLGWQLSTTAAIDSITLNGNSGNIFFDILFQAGEVTPGSSTGFWAPSTWVDSTATSGFTSGSELYNFGGGNQTHGADFNWKFSNPGYLSSAGVFPDPPTGPHDLFEQLFIDFTAVDGFTGTFNFGVDTDRVEGGQPIPEPTTMILFGLGLLGLGAVGRRKQ